jgi:hypothetical protein
MLHFVCVCLYVNAALCVIVALLKAIDLRPSPCVHRVSQRGQRPCNPDETSGTNKAKTNYET